MPTMVNQLRRENRGVDSMLEGEEITVLLVEDSVEERRLICLELAEIEEPHFRSLEAGRLADAETELTRGRADVVLLDLSLPDSVGLKGLSRLCQRFPSLPIVVYTGLDDQKVALQALREGGQDFLVKGHTPSSVLKRVLLHAIERKRVEVALSGSQESLRAAQRLEIVGRLAGKIAHDFNNILTTIVGFTDLLLEDMAGQPGERDLLEIKKAGKRGAALTQNILSFARKEVSIPSTVDLNEAILGLRGMLTQLLPASIELICDLDKDAPEVWAELGQVEQVIVNLVVNARDAMPAGGTITVSTRARGVALGSSSHGEPPPPGDYGSVIVQDTGLGISAEILERIFQPFYTTKPRGVGTGLGLSTVAGIARRCGGGIEVESTPGVGSRFILSLPVYAESLGAEPESNGVAQAEMVKTEAETSSLELDILSFLNEYEGESEEKRPVTTSGIGEKTAGSTKEKLEEHLRHLCYVVAHDFHEPLRMVSSYLKLLRRRAGDSLPQDFLEFLDYALEGGQRLQQMLDGVLRYSRVLQAPLRDDPTSVEQIYRRVLEDLPGSDIVEWVGEKPHLLVSADHFTILLRELLSNAMKFANPMSPKVHVEFRRHHGLSQFRVCDNGLGIPQEAVEKCFRLFGRLHGRDEYPGLGVGLTIAQALAEKYGGDLKVDGAVNGCIVLLWPTERILESR